MRKQVAMVTSVAIVCFFVGTLFNMNFIATAISNLQTNARWRSPALELYQTEDLYYHTFLESIDGFQSAGAVQQAGYVDLITGGQTGDAAYLRFIPNNPIRWLDFAKPFRFRTTINLISTTAQVAYITVGINALMGNAIGFKIVDDVVYGVAENNGVDTTVQLGQYGIDIGFGSVLECVYTPDLAKFYADKTLLGTLTSGFPPHISDEPQYLMNIYIRTTDDAPKELYAGEWELLGRTQSAMVVGD